MNKTILSLIAVVLVGFASYAAETNSAALTLPTPNLSLTNAPAESGKSAGSWEFTLGGAGQTIKGDSSFGLDFSISTNPFEKRPEIWVGLSQGLYWEPTFSGSTDLFVDWSWALFPKTFNDSLYLNTGWTVGILYDNSGTDPIYRTGPEAYLQYYTSDNAFIYAGLNWDFVSEGDDGLRYCFGIGLSF